MANPAALLADLIESWAVPPNKQPEQVRAEVIGSPAHSREFWAQHQRAVAYLSEIERALIAMEAAGETVDFYRDALIDWYRAVFAITAPWGTNVNKVRPLAGKPTMSVLRALAHNLEATDYAPTVDATQLRTILDALDEAQALILESEDVPKEVRRYLLGLVSEARACGIEFQTFGSVALRTRVFELGGAMMLVADTDAVADAEKENWRDKAKRVLGGVGVGAAGQLAADAVSEGARALGM